MEIDKAKKMIFEECTIHEIKTETKLPSAIIRQLKKEIKKEMDIIRDLYSFNSNKVRLRSLDSDETGITVLFQFQ